MRGKLVLKVVVRHAVTYVVLSSKWDEAQNMYVLSCQDAATGESVEQWMSKKDFDLLPLFELKVEVVGTV